jgi:hypothetical protein
MCLLQVVSLLQETGRGIAGRHILRIQTETSDLHISQEMMGQLARQYLIAPDKTGHIHRRDRKARDLSTVDRSVDSMSILLHQQGHIVRQPGHLRHQELRREVVLLAGVVRHHQEVRVHQAQEVRVDPRRVAAPDEATSHSVIILLK